MNYFVINKELDYQRGYLEDTQYTQGNLTLRAWKKQGAFISRIFDSQKEETIWHRFVLSGEGRGGASLLFTFYAFDHLEFYLEDKQRLISDFLRDNRYSLLEKKERLKPFEQKQVLFPRDILLHEVKGRYLFFIAQLSALGGEIPRVSEMILYFPKTDWLGYLPQVYQREKAGADFTSRFLGIFQSFYEDMDWKIKTSSRLLNPKDTQISCLKQIAGWFHLEDIYLWPEEKLRKLIEHAPRLFAQAGTVKGMLDFLCLYTGEEPILIENGMEEGEDPYEFTLLIKERYLSGIREYQGLMCLIRQMKPAHMQVKLIALKPRIVLGDYSFLGINSEIGSCRPAALDGCSSLAFSSVGRIEAEGGEE